MRTKAKHSDAATTGDVEQLTRRIQKLEARCAGLVAETNRLKEQGPSAPEIGDGAGPPRAAEAEKPVRFTDPIDGPPASVVMVSRAVIAAGAEELRDLFDERSRLLGELRELQRRRKSARQSHAHWREVKRDLRRPFPGAPVGRHPGEDKAPDRLRALEAEIEETT